MKKAKITKKKEKKEPIPESTLSIKTVAITFLSIAIVFVATYFLTDFLLSRRSKSTDSSSNSATQQTNTIVFSNLLSQSAEKYYVLAMVDEKSEAYERYLSWMSKTYYIVDMSNKVNQVYLGKEEVIGDSIKDIRITDSTLFVVEDGKITNHATGKENILKYLEEELKEAAADSNS